MNLSGLEIERGLQIAVWKWLRFGDSPAFAYAEQFGRRGASYREVCRSFPRSVLKGIRRAHQRRQIRRWDGCSDPARTKAAKLFNAAIDPDQATTIQDQYWLG